MPDCSPNDDSLFLVGGAVQLVVVGNVEMDGSISNLQSVKFLSSAPSMGSENISEGKVVATKILPGSTD